jgi:predicted Zn-dependent protease
MGILFPRRSSSDGYQRSPLSGCSMRIIIALVIAGISLFTYWKARSPNPVTGQMQHVNLTVDEEIALGLNAAAAMAAQFGGLTPDQDARLKVDDIGQRILTRSDASKAPYQFAFNALADPNTVNAFALPGGQVFITQALLSRLSTDGQIAGVLSHEIGHVIARHSAQQLAKSQLLQGLTGAAVIAATDPNNPSTYNNGMVAQLVAQMIGMKYSRSDELDADHWGVKLMAQAGYDPRSMVEVMKVLEQAGGGGRQPEFMSTHPDPGNRIEKIERAIKDLYPNGLPEGLER